MVWSFSVSLSRRLKLATACLSVALALPALGIVQVASGTPTEDGISRNVRMPLYFYSDEVITAGQFDVSVPEGWSVLEVESDGALEGVQSVDADALVDGGIRVVLFSLNSSEIPVGPLGTVLLSPPSVGEIASLDFSNSLFVNEGGDSTAITAGFPDFQILAQPNNQTILAGQRSILNISVLGIDPSYSWYEGSAGDTSSPVGSDAALFQTPILSASTSYWVRVTDTFGESLDSTVANVTVDTGPTFIFSPNSRAVGWRAGSGQAMLETPTGTAWTASSSAEWLLLETSSGTGSSGIHYTFEKNSSLGDRTAQISVGGVTYTVNQSARPSMFADYPKVDDVSEWRDVPWFGYVTDNNYPWVYHRNHGWLFIYPTADLNEFYAYSAKSDLGWLYISTSFYNSAMRWMYSFQYESYLFFHPVDAFNPDSRLFYRADTRSWFSFPE